MEQLELSYQNQTVNWEVDKDDNEHVVEFLIEVKVPCLICGANTEINNIIKQEVLELDEDSSANAGGSGSADHCIFHSFLKLFGVEIVKKGKQRVVDRGWDGEGGDILRFCGNCKIELVEILNCHKQVDELKEKIKTGLGEVKGKMEGCEDAFQTNGIYLQDNRYGLVRSQIVRNVHEETSKNNPQENLRPTTKTINESSRRSSRLEVKRIVARADLPNSTIEDGSGLLIGIDSTTTLSSCSISEISRSSEATLQEKQVVNKLIRRTSSRLKKITFQTEVETKKGYQEAKETVQAKLRRRKSSKRHTLEPTLEQEDGEDEQGNSSDLSEKDNSKVRRRKKWNFKLDTSKNTIIFEGIEFSIPTNVKEKVFCASCNVTLSYDREVMRHHIIKNHKKWFACSKCSFQGLCRKQLQKHVQIYHDGILDECPKCGKSYASLKSHMIQQHTKRFKCAVQGCWRTYKTRALLTDHKIVAHSKPGPWKCTVCTKEFYYKGQFQVHMNLHNGIRPFKCPVEGCEAAFTKKGVLKQHHNYFHTEESNPKRKSFQKGPTILKTGDMKDKWIET